MRAAAIADSWRRLRRGNRLLNRLTIAWRNVPRLSDGSLSILKPITLICGENGAGKSSLLHLLYQALLSSDDSAEHGHYCRPQKGQIADIEVELRDELGGQILSKRNDEAIEYFDGGSDGPLVSIVDSGMHVPALISYVRGQANFSDLLEGVTPHELDSDELSRASFIVGRDYSAIQVWEVVDSSFGPLFPYFVATSYGVSYGSEEMGYGELSSIYFVWLLSRLVAGSLLLIEEPEAFLSPRAQVALVDVLADSAGRQQISIVMTSHSGAIATKLDLSEITYLTRSIGDVRWHSPPRLNDLIERLGLMPQRECILFVEDRVASIFVRALVDKFSAKLGGRGELVIMNGDGGVRSVIRKLPGTIKSIAHVGILDGDQRRAVDGDEPRLMCLPGDEAPEVMLIAYSKTLGDGDLASVIGCDSADVLRAIAHAGGSDLHEWIPNLARDLGLSQEEVLRRLTLAWATANLDQVNEFISQLEAAVAISNDYA